MEFERRESKRLKQSSRLISRITTWGRAGSQIPVISVVQYFDWGAGGEAYPCQIHMIDPAVLVGEEIPAFVAAVEDAAKVVKDWDQIAGQTFPEVPWLQESKRVERDAALDGVLGPDDTYISPYALPPDAQESK
jgi:hypothetical protein